MEMLQLFEYIEDNGLTPNQYYLLWSIHHKRIPKHINGNLELKSLIADGFVKDKVLTAKGLELLDVVNKEVKPGTVVVKTFDVESYINIFPSGKLPSGKPSRVNKKNIEEAFKWFFKNYDYDWDTVVKATQMYIDEYELKKYMYMRNSQYFIRKQNTDKTWESELANYCEIVLSGDEPESNHFSEKVV
jgi:hypothetical protein